MSKGMSFKGFSRHLDDWIISDSICNYDRLHVFFWHEHREIPRWMSVEPESVGVSTGFHDRRCQEIFSGDILRGPCGCTYPVEMVNGKWTIVGSGLDITRSYMFEIVGNVYTDHPEKCKFFEEEICNES